MPTSDSPGARAENLDSLWAWIMWTAGLGALGFLILFVVMFILWAFPKKSCTDTGSQGNGDGEEAARTDVEPLTSMQNVPPYSVIGNASATDSGQAEVITVPPGSLLFASADGIVPLPIGAAGTSLYSRGMRYGLEWR